jgi:uncharacterized C2H2 Zn-finger protein
MATLKCPKCDSKFSAGDGWAKAAVSTLIAAPAIPDMATQVRCPECRYLFAEGDIRYLRSSWPKGLNTGLSILGLAFIAWVAYQVLLA